jgi:hypothetical protein
MSKFVVHSGVVIDFGSDWAEFKKWMNGTYANLPHVWAEDDHTYTVIVQEASFYRMCAFNKGSSESDDFEASWKVTKLLEPKARTGVPGHAPAKGLGGFAPDPHNNPYAPDPDEVVSHYVDAEGQLMVRGPTLTDEGSFRDDFTWDSLETDLTGTVSFTNGSDVVTGDGTLFTEEINRDHYIKLTTDGLSKWVAVVRAPTDSSLLLESPYEGSTGTGTAHKTRWIKHLIGETPGSISVSSSNVQIASGTASGGGVHLVRDGDYPPMVAVWRAALSQRVANQTAFFGFRNNHTDPSMYCDVVFAGTDSTSLSFRSAWDGDEESTTVSLPPGLDTSQSLRYKIDVSVDYCALLVNGVLVAKHDNHIPDMYADMSLCAGIENDATVTDTTLSIDTVYWSNQDQIQIASVFQAPVPIIIREDQHHFSGKKTTAATTANQTILSYTVPAGKVFYLIGYKIDTEGTVSGIIKIGRNDVSSEPVAPGEMDGHIFRCFELGAGGTTGEVDFGSNPRRLGVGGDTILVTVTPVASLSTIWRATLDFVLR